MDFLHCWAKFQADRLYKSNDTYQYKCGGVKAYKKGKGLLPVAVRHSKTPKLNLNFIRGNENVTPSAQSETAFLGEIFCSEYPSRRSEKGNLFR